MHSEHALFDQTNIEKSTTDIASGSPSTPSRMSSSPIKSVCEDDEGDKSPKNQQGPDRSPPGSPLRPSPATYPLSSEGHHSHRGDSDQRDMVEDSERFQEKTNQSEKREETGELSNRDSYDDSDQVKRGMSKDFDAADTTADLRIIQQFTSISGDWTTIGSGRPNVPLHMYAFCVDEEKLDSEGESDDGRILALGRKRKKDDTIFRLEVFHRLGGQVTHSRDIRDSFAGGSMCFLTPSILCYSSWNNSSGSPLVRLFNCIQSDLGPSLHTQNFLRRRTHHRFPGGFFQNFRGLIPFVVDESDPTSSRLRLKPHVFGWSLEGIVCVWEMSCVVADTKTGRLQLRDPINGGFPSMRRNGGKMRPKAQRSADAGKLRRIEYFPKDVLNNRKTLAFRNRILGATISTCGTKIFVVDRYWRLWIYHWQNNEHQCIGLAPLLQNFRPLKGSSTKPFSTFRKGSEKFASEASNGIRVLEKNDPPTPWDDVPRAEWLLKPKQISLVYADQSDTIVVGTRMGLLDEKEAKVKGVIEPNGTLWPPSWRESDWLISFDIKKEEIVDIQEAWHPVKGPGRFIFALTDKEPDSALDISPKRKDKRGLLLLREHDLCVVADSRQKVQAASFDKFVIKEFQSASYPPVADNSKFFELQRKMSSAQELNLNSDEKSNIWPFYPFTKARGPNGGSQGTAFSLCCLDGFGNAALVGAYGV